MPDATTVKRTPSRQRRRQRVVVRIALALALCACAFLAVASNLSLTVALVRSVGTEISRWEHLADAPGGGRIRGSAGADAGVVPGARNFGATRNVGAGSSTGANADATPAATGGRRGGGDDVGAKSAAKGMIVAASANNDVRLQLKEEPAAGKIAAAPGGPAGVVDDAGASAIARFRRRQAAGANREATGKKSADVPLQRKEVQAAGEAAAWKFVDASGGDFAGVAADAVPGGARNISVVSYSVYGNQTRYLIPLLVNAQSLAPKLYPGWQVRVYHDASVPPETLSRLRALDHVRLVDVADVGKPTEPLLPADWGEWLPKIAPTTWRFLVAVDPTVDRYMIRDSDSLLGSREKAAVDEWIDSGSPFHVMHDHPYHYRFEGKNVSMLAGMWGGRRVSSGRRPPAESLRLDMAKLLGEWYERPRSQTVAAGPRVRGDDQDFLSAKVWPIVDALGPGGSVRHNSYHCDSNDGVAFPTAGVFDLGGEGYDFVGDVVLFRSDKNTGRFVMRNRYGICMLVKAINDPAAGDERRERYGGCVRRRSERGLKTATGFADRANPAPQCKAPRVSSNSVLRSQN